MSRVARLATIASVATDACLLAALGTWQWTQRQPFAGARPRLPLLLALATLACGAVALIASRRSNRVLLFLVDFSAVLAAAWLFDHLYRQAALGRPFWLR